MADNPLRDFVTSVLKEKNLVGVDQEILDKLTDDLVVRLQDQINRGLIDSLDEKQFAEFEKLVAAEDTKKLSTFFTDSGVPVQNVITEVMAKFRVAYLGS